MDNELKIALARIALLEEELEDTKEELRLAENECIALENQVSDLEEELSNV